MQAGGLAISRSIGDINLASAGVVPLADVLIQVSPTVTFLYCRFTSPAAEQRDLSSHISSRDRHYTLYFKGSE